MRVSISCALLPAPLWHAATPDVIEARRLLWRQNSALNLLHNLWVNYLQGPCWIAWSGTMAKCGGLRLTHPRCTSQGLEKEPWPTSCP